MSLPGLLGLLPRCLGLFWGQKLGGLGQPVADTCGPYKKIIDQICSILPWLLEGEGQNLGGLWQPVAACGRYLWPL